MTQPTPPPATGLDGLKWEDGMAEVLKAPATDRSLFYNPPWISLIETHPVDRENLFADDVNPSNNEFSFTQYMGATPEDTWLRVKGRIDWYVGASGSTPHERFWGEFWNHSRDTLQNPPSPLPLDPKTFHVVAESMYNLAMWLEDATAELQREINSLDGGGGFAGAAAQAYRESLETTRKEMLILRDDLESSKNWPQMLHDNGDAADKFWREVRRAWSEWSNYVTNQPSEMIRRVLEQIKAQMDANVSGGTLNLDFGNGTKTYDFRNAGALAELNKDMHDYFLTRVNVLDQEMRTQYGSLRNSFDDTATNLLDPRNAPPPTVGGPGTGGNTNIPKIGDGGPGTGGGANIPKVGGGGGGGSFDTDDLGGGGDGTGGGTGGGGGGGSFDVSDLGGGGGGGTGGLGGPPPGGSFDLGEGGGAGGGVGGGGTGGSGGPLPGGSFSGGLPGTGTGGAGLGGLGGSSGGSGAIPGGGFIGGPGLGGLPSVGGGRPPGRDEPGLGSGGIGSGNGDFEEGPSTIDPDDLPGGSGSFPSLPGGSGAGSGGSLPGLGGSSGSDIGGSLPGLGGGSSNVGGLPGIPGGLPGIPGGLPGIPGGGSGGDYFGGASGSDGVGDGWSGADWQSGSNSGVPGGSMQIGPLGPAPLATDGFAAAASGGSGLAGLTPTAVAGAAGGGLVGGTAGATGMGGMGPMMPPMGGAAGGQQQEKDRERKTWLAEEEEVWGTDPDVAPSVIGRDDVPDVPGVERTRPTAPQNPASPYPPARGTGRQSSRGY